jgi:hypothetical protein
MKYTFLTLLFVFTLINYSYSQIDQNGNPIFNSIATDGERVDSAYLLSNYYTLKNNIDNKKSSVYISENPTLEEIENAATNLPSDFFILTNGQQVISMIMVLNSPSRSFLVVKPKTGESKKYKCKIKGDISENRANEIIEMKYDTNANINNGTLLFNNKKLKIYTKKDVKIAVLDLIKSEKLSLGGASNMKILSFDEMKVNILKESKEGGKLDFFTPIKDKEMDGIQIKPGVFSTKISVALYKWGKALYEMGVNKIEDAYLIFSEFKGRALNIKEKDYIKLGFDRELEK